MATRNKAESRKQPRSTNNENDIEMDCLPLNSATDRLQPKYLLQSKDALDSRCDSAYDSGFKSYTSDKSFTSDDLPSEVNEGRQINDEDSLIPVSNLKSLTLVDPVDSSKSVDEGFYSRDDLPLDLSLKSRDLSKSPAICDQNERLKQEKIDAFVQHVEETYQQDDDGDTQLHTAIIQLLFEFCLYCISLAPSHVYLNFKNNYLQTPLHLATITKQVALVRKLMSAGAQVDARDHNGNTALHIAAKEGYTVVAAALLEPLRYEETTENNYDIPFQQIPQDLEARNYNGQVCVHLAAEEGHLDVLRVLLDTGANVNCRDGKSGRTILHYAAESGCMPLLNFLVRRPDVDVHAMTYSRLTPIMLAKGRNHVEAVRLLKECGAFLDTDDSEEDMNEEPYDDFKIGGNPV